MHRGGRGEERQEARPDPKKPDSHGTVDGLEVKGHAVHWVTVTFVF